MSANGEVTPDWRLLSNGLRIPARNYCDQPYVVKTDDGAWLVCVTTGQGEEGEKGQHIAVARSADRGKTWSGLSAVEPEYTVENSYAVPLKAPSGRIFLFYTRNSGNVREILSHDGEQRLSRVDSLGEFVFKYSDDHGRTWNRDPVPVPVREFACDRANVYGGRIRFLWNVGHPFVLDGSAFVSLTKVGEMGEGFFQRSEGVLLESPDLLTMADPAKAAWSTRPDGDAGLRAPEGGGPISEEHNFLPLSDGSLYVTYRTVDGYPVEAYSRDRGRTWTPPRYMQYGDGRRVKHPRAANFAWRASNGKYLYWFHNHGGEFFAGRRNAAYDDRNPVWLAAGVEYGAEDGRRIRWGEPEILLHDDNPAARVSYPDFVEDGGRYFFTETDKATARAHEVPAAFLEAMWRAVEGRDVEVPQPVIWRYAAGSSVPAGVALPKLYAPDPRRMDRRGERIRTGYSFHVELEPGAPCGAVAHCRGRDGRGFALERDGDGRIVFLLDDGVGESRMASEPAPGVRRFVVVVDGGAGIVSFVADGRFLDGGGDRQFGWRRFDPALTLRHPDQQPWNVGPGVRAVEVRSGLMQTAQAVAWTRGLRNASASPLAASAPSTQIRARVHDGRLAPKNLGLAPK